MEETEIRIAEFAQVHFCFLFEFCFQNMLSKNNYCLGFPSAVSAVTFMTVVQENFRVLKWERDLLTLCPNCIT